MRTLNLRPPDMLLSMRGVFLPNLFAHQVGVKLEYQYIRDNSNDPTASFVDNMVTASVVARF